MKKIILVIAIAGMSLQLQAQKVQTSSVPVAVTNAFNQSHQTVKDVDWNLKDGNYYVASYEEGSTDMYIKYDASGNLVDTKMEIESSMLPAPVMSYVKQNYKEDEVRKAYKITNAGGTVTYTAKVDDQYLLFDSNGTYIKPVKK